MKDFSKANYFVSEETPRKKGLVINKDKSWRLQQMSSSVKFVENYLAVPTYHRLPTVTLFSFFFLNIIYINKILNTSLQFVFYVVICPPLYQMP